MDISITGKMLRVCKSVNRAPWVGKKNPSLDVRVLAPRNRTLREEVKAGRFRKILFYRLNVFPLQLLRFTERPEICGHWLMQATGTSLSARGKGSASFWIMKHKLNCPGISWRGNCGVNLDNVIQRALIFYSGGSVIKADEPCLWKPWLETRKITVIHNQQQWWSTMIPNPTDGKCRMTYAVTNKRHIPRHNWPNNRGQQTWDSKRN